MLIKTEAGGWQRATTDAQIDAALGTGAEAFRAESPDVRALQDLWNRTIVPQQQIEIATREPVTMYNIFSVEKCLTCQRETALQIPASRTRASGPTLGAHSPACGPHAEDAVPRTGNTPQACRRPDQPQTFTNHTVPARAHSRRPVAGAPGPSQPEAAQTWQNTSA